MQSEVSVIMPAYKAAQTIERALLSIKAQTIPPLEVVIVDDASPDATIEAAQRVDMGRIALRIFRQETNQGPGAARNRAIKESRGRYLAFLDADDEWLPRKIERSMEFIRQGNILVAHDGYEIRDGDVDILKCSRRFEEFPDRYIGLYRKGYIDTCSVVVLKDAVVSAGGFDPTLPVGQDFDLFLTILGRIDTPFTVFPERLVRYHITPGSVTSKTLLRLKCQMRILLRHAPNLEGRNDAAWKSRLFRTLAVHKEALDAFRRKGDWLGMLFSLLLLPFHLLKAFFTVPKYFLRRDFLNNEKVAQIP